MSEKRIDLSKYRKTEASPTSSKLSPPLVKPQTVSSSKLDTKKLESYPTQILNVSADDTALLLLALDSIKVQLPRTAHQADNLIARLDTMLDYWRAEGELNRHEDLVLRYWYLTRECNLHLDPVEAWTPQTSLNDGTPIPAAKFRAECESRFFAVLDIEKVDIAKVAKFANACVVIKPTSASRPKGSAKVAKVKKAKAPEMTMEEFEVAMMKLTQEKKDRQLWDTTLIKT